MIGYVVSTVSDRIETDRLTLSRHRLDDFTDSLSMWSDPEIARHISGRPSTAEEVWSRLLRYVGHWQALGSGYWLIREKDTGRFVGEIGFADFKREIDPPFDGAPEMGWALCSWAQGRGYAFEALNAALDWGRARFDGAHVVCMISPLNAPSIRLAERAGFRRYAETDYKGSPTLLFRL